MKCPVCKTRLTIIQDLDHGYNNGDSEGLWQDVAGVCEECGRKYIWTQHYTLVTEDDLDIDDL